MSGVTCAELTFIDGIVFGFLGFVLLYCLLKIAYHLGADAGGDE
jgi:hypothetical protein